MTSSPIGACLFCLALAMFSAARAEAQTQSPLPQAPQQSSPWMPGTAEGNLAQACCKVCRKGKACGDSCISKEKACEKPKGCACDAAPLQ